MLIVCSGVPYRVLSHSPNAGHPGCVQSRPVKSGDAVNVPVRVLMRGRHAQILLGVWVGLPRHGVNIWVNMRSASKDKQRWRQCLCRATVPERGV